MATIGHSLLGLSLASTSSTAARGGALRYIWIGLVVLMAHLVDVVEWLLVLVAPGQFDGHFFEHSPWLTFALIGVVWAAVAIFTDLRKPWPYLVLAAAILSHLLLDYRAMRIFLANMYVYQPVHQYPFFFIESFTAECWFYGLVLVLILLWKADREPHPNREPAASRPHRTWTGLLAAASIFAATTRKDYIWMPTYLFSLSCAAIALRRHFRLGMLWGLVPLIPLFALVGVEIAATKIAHRAEGARLNGDCQTAVRLYQDVLKLRTRSAQGWTYIHLGQCYESLGQLADAESAYFRGVQELEPPAWAQYWLARFYVCLAVQNTPYFRPDESERVFREILDSKPPAQLRTLAQQFLSLLDSEYGPPAPAP